MISTAAITLNLISLIGTIFIGLICIFMLSMLLPSIIRKHDVVLILVANNYLALLAFALVAVPTNIDMVRGDYNLYIGMETFGCRIRAYIIYTSLAIIFHTFVLQQNVCLLPVHSARGFIWSILIIYGIPIIVINIIYIQLTRFIRRSSKIASTRAKRDVIVVRRIVLVAGILTLMGIPSVILKLMLPFTDDVEYAAAEILAINAGHYIRFALDKPVLRLYTVIYSTAWYWIVWLADVALLLLPCIERPAYFKEVPAWVALIIEIIALSILLASFILSMRLQDKRKLLREAVFPYIFAGVFLLTTIDMIIYYILIFNGHYYVRWSRPLRVLFPFALQAGQNIRRVIRNILRTLPNIGNVMFLFLFSVLTFTLLGVGILKNKKLMYPNKSEYFTHYLDTAWDLYVLTTTANNPDVMMPAFNSSILYVIFFVAYLLVNLYLFMNLLLAEEKQLIHKRQLDTLMIMFERLTKHNSNRCISYETYTCLMRAIKPHITEHIIDAYWKTLNITNKEDGLNVKQFNELLLNLNFELRQRSADQTILQKQCPSIYNSKPSRIIIDFVNTDLFRAIINLLIVGNAVCLAASYNDLEWFFLSLFIVEALLKMYAIGVKEYFHHRWNIFDFTIVFVSTTYSLLTAIIKSLSLNRDILDAILVIRVLRLVKIVGNVERFKVIFGTFSKVIPTLITYLRVMFMTYYVFAMIGMEIFQNKIVHLDSNSTSAEFCNDTRLNGSDFAKAQYCRNNFNDYLSSLILLFALTVVNQWHVLASGFVLVTSKVARLFFLAFHLCAVIVVLNIFTAFVIDSFLNQYILSKSKEFPWMEQENVIAERLTQHGYRIIRRYDNTKLSEGGAKKKFNLLEKLRAFVQPSIYRRMTVILQTMADDEHALLLQWRGDVDIDPVALLNLTNDSS
ncbi:unnamed protein product [Rotaria sp. Silwood1]|nr:unnamed protein product [Rotaria sp. Silwood1]